MRDEANLRDSDTLTEWSDALYDSYKKDYRTRVSKDQVCSYYMKHLQKLCERKDLESCQTYHTFLLIHDVVPDPKRRKSAYRRGGLAPSYDEGAGHV